MRNSSEWERVRLLFQAALELPAGARESYLSTACPDDARVRDEVRSLLGAHGEAGAFLETPVGRISAPTAATPAFTLQPGDRLGDFTIVAALGAGGMGEVYRARDARLDRDVAIKLLPPALAADPQRLARFERESRLLASLNHPHIGAIHSVEHVDGLHLLVLELVDGSTLDERVVGGPLPVRDALAIARQLTAALEAAHERGIVHRDLKPSNVKLSPTGSVKLLDFGLAKSHAPHDAATPLLPAAAPHTIEGLVLGTCGYMSPEQARGQPVDRRADIWAFGCLLFELLSGRPAFRGNTPSDTIAAVLERSPDWSALPPELPAGVRRLLRRCLEKDAEQRLHDIADARIEIDDVLRGEDEAQAGPVATRSSRRRAWLAPIVTLAGAVLVWWVWTAATTSETPLPLTRFTWSLPANTSLESPPAVSPDGRAIAFSASVSGEPPRLFVHEMHALDARAIPRTEGAKQPFWSPDSRAVGYFARGALMKVAIDGGAPVKICVAPDGRGAAWSPSGTIVFSPASIFAGLSRVSAAGGTPEPATLLDAAHAENSHRWPAFLPDGIHFLYFVRSVITERRGVYVGRIDRPASAPGTPLFRSETEGVYAPLEGDGGALLSVGAGQIDFRPFDARRLVLTGDPIRLPLPAGGNTPRQASMLSVSADVLAHVGSPLPYGQRLASIRRSGEDLHIDEHPGLVSWPRLSPDGSRLVFQRLDPVTGSPDLWVEHLERHTLVRVNQLGTSAQLPVWSPDGSRLAYVAAATGQQPALAVVAADGTGARSTLPCPRNRCEPSDWSPDGRWLIVHAIAGPSSDVWMLPTREDGSTARPLLAEAFVERDARVSSDGRLVAYVSEETGSPEISVQTIDGLKQREVVSAGGGSQPVWSRDGRELYFVDPAGLLRRTPVSRTPSGRPVLGPSTRLNVPALGTGHFGTQYDVSVDGRLYFLDRRIDDPPRDVGIVTGWRALVKSALSGTRH